MPALTLPSSFSAFSALARRWAPPAPVRTLIRSTGYKLRPPRPLPHTPAVTASRDAVLNRGQAEPRQLASLLCERRNGGRPTIVLGGFVPDSTEQVFLLRSFLLRHGSVYYLNYPAEGFSLDLLCAQLDDLVEELAEIRGQPPVVLAVSFGAGILVEWLRRARAAGRQPAVAGLALVSPVACVEDIMAADQVKPTTLVGRALKPYLAAGAADDPAIVERSRTIFSKMFEAGAQSRSAKPPIMAAAEMQQLHASVRNTIQAIDGVGAAERVQALRRMEPLSPWDASVRLPLSAAPTLVLYAEKESGVIAEGSPTRQALESALGAFFPRGECRIVAGESDDPVQHASLIFHYFQFLPLIAELYRGLKRGKFQLAA